MRIRRRRKFRVHKSPNWPCRLWCELAIIANLFFLLSTLILNLCCLSAFVLFSCFYCSIDILFGTCSYPHSFILLSSSPIVTPFAAFNSSCALENFNSDLRIRSVGIILGILRYFISSHFWRILSISQADSTCTLRCKLLLQLVWNI